MESLIDRLTLVERHVARAVETTRADSSASPVLLAVVLEFQRKAQKAHDTLSAGAAASIAREAVVEVELAADSANVAAAADPAASEVTRKAVEVAHKAMCLLKVEGSISCAASTAFTTWKIRRGARDTCAVRSPPTGRG